MDAQPLVIGLDHIYLTVSDLPSSERFYDPVMRGHRFRKGTSLKALRGALED